MMTAAVYEVWAKAPDVLHSYAVDMPFDGTDLGLRVAFTDHFSAAASTFEYVGTVQLHTALLKARVKGVRDGEECVCYMEIRGFHGLGDGIASA